MPSRPPIDYEEEDDDTSDIDPEGPDPSEMDSSDDPDLDVCPHCRKMIVEDAERCPHCGEYVSPGDAPLSRPAWILIAAIILLMAFLLAWTF
jgi:uncharacterized paraquat-inducible protein A